ncbi:MAG: hypothetical protein IT580_11395 [Verrucomicrobiales bacterium]|nr:hypothetical protein [Verrucomicrobiales bacterium]
MGSEQGRFESKGAIQVQVAHREFDEGSRIDGAGDEDHLRVIQHHHAAFEDGTEISVVG